jgi:hypothetical protein
MASMSIKHTAVISGDGRMTAGEIAKALATIPGEATLKIETHSDQRDGDSWNIFAEWDHVAQSNWHPTVKPPTFREVGGSGRRDT